MKKGMIILLIISLAILSGLIRVNASTISTSGNQFNMYYSSNPEACIDTVGYGYKNLDTSIHVSGITGNDYGTIKRIDYISTADLSANTNYTLSLIQSYNPKNFEMFTEEPWKFNIEGSTTTSNSNLSADNILSYSCNVTNISNKYQVRVVCNFTPKNSIKKLWLSMNTKCHTFSVDYFNTYNLKIESNNETSNAINNQTEVIIDKSDKIINEQNKTNEIISQDHNYNNNASENTENEKQQMENYEKEEDSLRNGLDLNIEESEITINPEANSFIWNVVNKLRGMSGKIILLFTSVLSLGIMKMILGR